jgi:hypothetical protein
MGADAFEVDAHGSVLKLLTCPMARDDSGFSQFRLFFF